MGSRLSRGSTSRYFSNPVFEEGEYFLAIVRQNRKFSSVRSFRVSAQDLNSVAKLSSEYRIIESINSPPDGSVWIISSTSTQKAHIPVDLQLRKQQAKLRFVFKKEPGKKKTRIYLSRAQQNGLNSSLATIAGGSRRQSERNSVHHFDSKFTKKNYVMHSKNF